MIEVYTNIFVGNQYDYESEVSRRTGWAVVQACKAPYHAQAVGYIANRSAPKGPEYYVARRSNRLILNIVDTPNPAFFNKEEMIDKALDFISEGLARNLKVLVHCNQGESRGPSIALLYLATRIHVLPDDSLEAAEAQFRLLYPSYLPNYGIREHMRQSWQQYCAYTTNH